MSSRYELVHHGFTVSDVDRSIAFYRDLLGLNVIFDTIRENRPALDSMLGHKGIRYRVAHFQDDAKSFILETIQYLTPPVKASEIDVHHVGISHLCFRVDNIHARYSRLMDAGVRCNHPPVEFRVNEDTTLWNLYLFDPDGIPMELIQAKE